MNERRYAQVKPNKVLKGQNGLACQTVTFVHKQGLKIVTNEYFTNH